MKIKFNRFLFLPLSLLLFLSFNVLGVRAIAPSNSSSKLDSLTSLVTNQKKKGYVPGEVIVKYKKGSIDLMSQSGIVKKNSFLQKTGLEESDIARNSNITVLKIKDNKTVDEKITELKEDPNVEYVQPNYQYYSTSIPTNDPYRGYLWGLDNTGQIVYDTTGAMDKDIDAPEAWSISARNPNSIVVAIIDTGVEYNHPDLVNSMWDGTNCVSDSGNALGGCLHGYDFANNDKYPLPNSIQDDGFDTPPHGTHLAGIVAAEQNNGTGVMGVAPDAKIMALKVDLTTVQIVKAINFAERNGAKIINASWGGSFSDSAMLEAINGFSGLFITSAGNGGGDTDPEGDNHDSGETLHSYPCDYTSANIICVAATDQIDVKASFSDYGATSVDVGAPGINILSTSSYSVVYGEDFSDEGEGTIPNAWIRGGINDTWGVREIDMPNPALSTNSYTPYPNNANSFLVSNKMDMTSEKGTFFFTTYCDTEYISYGWYDYATLSFTGNGGLSFWENLRWNEYSIDTDYSSTGWASKVFMRNVDPTFLTNNFKFKLGWITDFYGNSYNGCYIDDIYLIKEGLGSDGYEFMDGTSMASPYVAGVAALVWGYRPNLSPAEVKNAILNTGDSVASLSGKTTSGKRVNANNALLAVQGDVISSFVIQDGGTNYPCSVSEKLMKVYCNLPGNIAKTNVSPSISLTGGSIFPTSGTLTNLITSGTYTFTKSDETVESYTVDISDYFRTSTQFRSGQGNWGVSNTKYTTSGDFNGDGKDEIAAMYDYGNEDMAIIVFTPSGASFTNATWFRSGRGNWGVPFTKYLTAGDFDGDGKDEIAAMYDYGNEDMAMIMFTSNNSSFSTSTWFRSGKGNWGVPFTKYLTAGDFNGDGKDELNATYDYGNEDMAMIMFSPNNSSFSTSTWFRSGKWNWGVPFTKHITASDLNSDGKDELVTMYDYGNEDMAMITFSSNDSSFSTSTWFRSGIGNWGVSNTKYLTSGDFNGDGKKELSAMYDYNNEDMAMIVFSSNSSTFSTSTWFRSGSWNWGVPYTKHISAGDYDGNGIEEISAMYDYGNEDMAVILFR